MTLALAPSRILPPKVPKPSTKTKWRSKTWSGLWIKGKGGILPWFSLGKKQTFYRGFVHLHLKTPWDSDTIVAGAHAAGMLGCTKNLVDLVSERRSVSTTMGWPCMPVSSPETFGFNVLKLDVSTWQRNSCWGKYLLWSVFVCWICLLNINFYQDRAGQNDHEPTQLETGCWFCSFHPQSLWMAAELFLNAVTSVTSR